VYAVLHDNCVYIGFPYNKSLVSLLKATGCGPKWKPHVQMWEAPITLRLIEFLFKQNCELMPEDESALIDAGERLMQRDLNQKKMAKLARATEASPIPEVLEQLKRAGASVTPRTHQWVPIHHFLLSGGVQYLADEMRIGKSVSSTLCAFHPKWLDHTVFIVCPAHLIEDWQTKLSDYFNTISHVVDGPLPALIPGIRFYICSYERTHFLNDGHKLYNYGEKLFLIADEAQELKNPKTIRVKNFRQLSRQSAVRMWLSGTPIPNRVKELFTQLDLLDPGFMNWKRFVYEFCKAFYMALPPTENDEQRGFMVTTGYSNLDKLYKMLEAKYMVRRTQEEVWKYLPEKIHEPIYLGARDLPGKSSFAKWCQNSKEKHTDPMFLSLMKDVVTDGYKTLLFGHFAEMLDALERICQDANIGYVRIDGKDSSKQKLAKVHQFQTDPDTVVSIMSITATSTGLTLSAARVIVFCEIFPQDAMMRQAMARADLEDKIDPTIVIYPIYSLLERRLCELVSTKRMISKRAIDGVSEKTISDVDLLKVIADETGIPVGKVSI